MISSRPARRASATILLAGLAALGTLHCEASRNAARAPSPPLAAVERAPLPHPAPPAALPEEAQVTAPIPPSPVFYRTQRSDEWVEQTFILQPKYRRVLLVDASGRAPTTIRVPRLALNARRPAPEFDELAVDQVFRTLQEAADAAQGGYLVAVSPGTYAGFSLGDIPDAGDGRFVRFRALGAPGQVILDKPCQADGQRWMVYLRAAHHVIIEGFNLAGAGEPGVLPASGPWAGIMLDGDFGRTGKLAHHLAIVGNFSHNHAQWGLHSTDTHSVLIQDNLFARSAGEHSAYVSDGSDNYVIRRNVFFESYASGLQCNLDPEASLAEVKKHPAFHDYPALAPTRAWAEGLLKLAAERFGEHGFPDGRGVNFILEENVMNRNGRKGGGALNLAGLQESLIQNNLIYDNYNHGIAQWDNANPFDAAAVRAPPATASEAASLDRLPRWGCHDNLIRNNTVLLSNTKRAAILLVNGSYGCRLRNNILINDADVSIDVDAESVFRLDAGHDVTGTVRYRAEPFTMPPLTALSPALRALAISPAEGNRTTTSVTRQKLPSEVVAYSNEPWVIIEGTWWRLNPKRPNFRPRSGSKLLARQGDASELPPLDLEGRARREADIGALGQ